MTILGVRTVAELEDFIQNKQNLVQGMVTAYGAIKDRWIAKNKAEHDDWIADWRAFVARYSPAIESAKNVVLAIKAAFFVNSNMMPADQSYENISRALTRQTDGSYSKGDVQDLYQRLTNVAKSFDVPVQFDNVQPRAGTDFDLGVYKAADLAVKQVETTASSVGHSKYTWFAGGGLLLLGYIAWKK